MVAGTNKFTGFTLLFILFSSLVLQANTIDEHADYWFHVFSTATDGDIAFEETFEKIAKELPVRLRAAVLTKMLAMPVKTNDDRAGHIVTLKYLQAANGLHWTYELDEAVAHDRTNPDETIRTYWTDLALEHYGTKARKDILDLLSSDSERVRIYVLEAIVANENNIWPDWRDILNKYIRCNENLPIHKKSVEIAKDELTNK
jgi:hypothetical protein